ncbi:hypothetical protein [Devosia sediminis]|uniref:DUF2961 domain-containing protein n=1 Tax=Devosia sediminis TaxID=2798801 RepID=A0A934MH93_9HYPH|nr:hypothetical protein [Devosia sediminis]MBJ3784832.1 hypothetical protein [Devosia sediminis]
MPARLLLAALVLPLALSPVAAKEKPPREEVACEGAFAIDSSEARLIEIYGAENVWTGTVPGPEGTEMLGTRVFPDDPERMLEFSWWDEEKREGLGNVDLPPNLAAPGGVRQGMTVAEVAEINGEPFALNGFGWDYGGYAGFKSGALSDLPGGCYLSLRFSPGDEPVKVNTDAIYGDRELQSTEPLLETVGAYVYGVSLGYPHPDFRD